MRNIKIKWNTGLEGANGPYAPTRFAVSEAYLKSSRTSTMQFFFAKLAAFTF